MSNEVCLLCRYGALGANTKIGWSGYLNKYSDKAPPFLRNDVGDCSIFTEETTDSFKA